MSDVELVLLAGPDGPTIRLVRAAGPAVVDYDSLTSMSASIQIGHQFSVQTGVETLGGDGIDVWFRELAELWRGWDGERTWRSLEHDMRIAATHDGIGHVTLRVTLRGPPAYDPLWEASTSVRIDAGEDMRRVADDVERFMSG